MNIVICFDGTIQFPVPQSVLLSSQLHCRYVHIISANALKLYL